MKKASIILPIAVLVLVSFSSCEKLVDKIFPGIDTKLPDIQITIPIIPIVPPNEISMGSFSTHINLDSTIRANTNGLFGIGVVSSIKVKEVVVSLSNGDALNNLSNLESTRVSLTSDKNSVPANLIMLNFPDAYATTLTSTPTDSPELLPYLNGSEVTYTMYGKVRRITTKPLNMNLTITIRVK